MILNILTRLFRPWLAYYVSAILGGFAALWIQSQGLFAWESWGYLLAVVFIPPAVKAVQDSGLKIESWIQDQVNKQLTSTSPPGTLTPEEIERLVRESAQQIFEQQKTITEPEKQDRGELKI